MTAAANAAAAVDVAARTLRIPAEAILSCEAIKHGLTNQSWLVRTKQDDVVVRISNTAEQALQIDRESEALVLAAVDEAGIGPEVIRCDPAERVLVTRYLGDTWAEADAVNDQNIQRLGQLFRRLHRVPPPAGVRRVELNDTLEGYFRTLQERGIQPALTSKTLRDRALQVALKLRENSAATLCHNDVHHLNVTDDGKLRLIDWEYAGVGQRLFDLASVCVYHKYDKLQREQLLAAYTALTELTTWHRLELACWLFDYVRDLWMAVRESSGPAA
ncbi:phosphotransferase [Steroidobacter sp. S1-65]|uniref:Phosphotransferase n=1 Tax=Steroidobacter gossypii TaxID=2805490 RepID=A0ABS1WQG8_9GAMM|nr:choline/ethanolamine kinase family protein [Steroidobacter gossypii]MBM0103208.1 phosphotransferase [Steroidobacter gossypii]